MGRRPAGRRREARRSPSGTAARHPPTCPDTPSADRRGGGGVVIEGNRYVVLGAKSGQVWFAPLLGLGHGRRRRWGRRLLQRQPLLLGRRIRPARAAQPLAHRGLAEAEPSRDLAVGVPLALESFHAPRERHPRASLRIAGGAAQRGHSAVLETLLVPAHRASRTIEDTRDVVLVGPTPLDQTQPRMGFGDTIANGVVSKHDPGDDHHAMAVLGAQQTSIIDYLRALWATRNRKQLGLSFGVRHTPRNTPPNRKSGQVWFAPPVPRSNELHPLKITKNDPTYVRRSELARHRIWRGAPSRRIKAHTLSHARKKSERPEAVPAWIPLGCSLPRRRWAGT